VDVFWALISSVKGASRAASALGSGLQQDGAITQQSAHFQECKTFYTSFLRLTTAIAFHLTASKFTQAIRRSVLDNEPTEPRFCLAHEPAVEL